MLPESCPNENPNGTPEAYFTMGTIAAPEELGRLRAALLEDCKRDTLVLLCLLEKMRDKEAADAKG